MKRSVGAPQCLRPSLSTLSPASVWTINFCDSLRTVIVTLSWHRLEFGNPQSVTAPTWNSDAVALLGYWWCPEIEGSLKQNIQKHLRVSVLSQLRIWASSVHCGRAVWARNLQPVPTKVRLEIVIGMQLEILDSGGILVNCTIKFNQNLNLHLYRKIQRNSN